MTDEDLADRVAAIERRLDQAYPEAPDRVEEERVEAMADRLAELEAAVEAIEGYVGEVERVDDELERRADAALAATDDLQARVQELETEVEGAGSPTPTATADTDDAGSVSEEQRIGPEGRPTGADGRSSGADAQSIGVDARTEGVDADADWPATAVDTDGGHVSAAEQPARDASNATRQPFAGEASGGESLPAGTAASRPLSDGQGHGTDGSRADGPADASSADRSRSDPTADASASPWVADGRRHADLRRGDDGRQPTDDRTHADGKRPADEPSHAGAAVSRDDSRAPASSTDAAAVTGGTTPDATRTPRNDGEHDPRVSGWGQQGGGEASDGSRHAAQQPISEPASDAAPDIATSAASRSGATGAGRTAAPSDAVGEPDTWNDQSLSGSTAPTERSTAERDGDEPGRTLFERLRELL